MTTTRTRRRTTVHDLASLRVHPDGSRVQSLLPDDDGSLPLVSSQTSLRASKYVSQDARGNWIARDAGGAGVVKRKYAKRQDKGKGRAQAAEGSDAEDIDIDIAVEEGESSRTDPRTLKRQKFHHDYSFLNSSRIEDELPPSSSQPAEASSSADNPAEPNTPSSMPIPSSDLLKCVHYFASEYYAANGQLSDVAKEARREAKLLKTRRLEVEINEQDGSNEEEAIQIQDEDGEDDVASPDEGIPSETRKKRGGRKVGKKWAEGRIPRDMYKAFDGSALMAIGMLIQEHVAELMDVEPTEEWVEQMEGREVEDTTDQLVKGGKRHRRQNTKKAQRREAALENVDEDSDLLSETSSSESSSELSSSSVTSSTNSDGDGDTSSDESESST